MRGQSTKDKIFNVAAKLFAESSYKDVSLRDIANEVGIKAPSIYNYYASKEEILDDLLDYYSQRLMQFDENLKYVDENMTPQEQLHRMIFSFLPEEKPLMRSLIKIVYKEQFWNEKARDIVLVLSLKNKKEDFITYFNHLRESGIHVSEYANYYAEILVRISMTYALDFVLSTSEDERDDTMEEISEFVLKLAMEY